MMMNKNMMAVLVASLGLLVGCGGGAGSTTDQGAPAEQAPQALANHGLGYDYDAELANGLRVKARTTDTKSIEYVDDVWQQVQECAWRTLGKAPEVTGGPLVVFVDYTMEGDSAGHIWYDSGTIGIRLASSDDRKLAYLVIAHEFVHWILYYHQLVSPEQNSAHDSELFMACAAAGRVNRPGV